MHMLSFLAIDALDGSVKNDLQAACTALDLDFEDIKVQTCLIK